MALQFEIDGFGDRDDAQNDPNTAYLAGNTMTLMSTSGSAIANTGSFTIGFNVELGAATENFKNAANIYLNMGDYSDQAVFTLNANTMGSATRFTQFRNAFSDSTVKFVTIEINYDWAGNHGTNPIIRSTTVNVIGSGGGNPGGGGSGPVAPVPGGTHYDFILEVRKYTDSYDEMKNDHHALQLLKADDDDISTEAYSNFLWGEDKYGIAAGSTMTIRFNKLTDKFNHNDTAVDQNFTFTFNLNDTDYTTFTLGLFTNGFNELDAAFKSGKQFELKIKYLQNPTQWLFDSITYKNSGIVIGGKEVLHMNIDGKEVSTIKFGTKEVEFWNV